MYPRLKIVNVVIISSTPSIHEELCHHVHQHVEPQRENDNPTVIRRQLVRLDEHYQGHRQVENVLHTSEDVVQNTWEEVPNLVYNIK